MASLYQYSEDYKQFFNVTATSQLQVWDTFSSENAHNFAEDKHLSRGYTSIALYTHTPPNNKSKGEDSITTQKFVALGTDKGSVVIWDLVTGQLLEKWDGKNKAHQKSVTGVVFGRSVLYSCSDDGNIIEWDISTGKVNHTWVGEKQGGLANIAINSKQTVLATASTTIKLWDLSSRQVLVKLTGHTSPVSCMQFSVDGLYLLTSSTDRYINMWSTDPSREQKSPIRVLSCESTPKVLQWNRHQPTEDLSQYDFLSVLQSGVVNIWSVNPQKQKKKGSPSGEIKIEGSQGDKAANLIFGDFTSENEILVTSDYLVNYESYRVQYTEEQDDQLVIKKETILTKKITSLLEPQQRKKKTNEISKEGDENEDKNENQNKRKREHVVREMDMPFEKTSNEKRTKKTEVPEGIAYVGVNIKQEPKEEKESSQKQRINPMEIKGAGSMISALTQAVHTKNELLLGKILNVVNDRSIQQTIGALPQDKVIPLLDFLVVRLRESPDQGQILVKWLKVVFEEHLLYLLEVPNILKILSPLYAIIDSRAAMFKKISTLSGKLDLLLRQADKIKRKKGKGLEQKPQFVFREADVQEESGNESDDEDNDKEEENKKDSGWKKEEPDTILEGDEYEEDEPLNGGDEGEGEASDEEDNE